MAADLTIEPWSRLAKIAPAGTASEDLQSAANRYEKSEDIYAAAADLWEEAATQLDLSPSELIEGTGSIQSVSQDGVSVTYAARGDAQTQRSLQASAYRSMARNFRQKAQPYSVPLGGKDMLDRYEENPCGPFFDPENGIIETYGY